MEIRITSGSYGWRETPEKAPKLVERGSTCTVDEAEAKRLFVLGVAEPVGDVREKALATDSTTTNDAAPCSDIPHNESGAESQQEAHLDAEQLQTLTVTQLRELAEKMCIPTAKLKKKDDLIAAIIAVSVEVVVEDEACADDADLPDLSAAAPIV